VERFNQADRHFFDNKGHRMLKYVDRVSSAYDEDAPGAAPSLRPPRTHDTTASPQRFVLVLRCYTSGRWGILAAAVFGASVALW
jgi:hypothetical protein